MRLFCTIVFLVIVTHIPTVFTQGQALFVKKDIEENGKRVTRQTSADQMVQNILQWLQGVYTQNSRRIRQGTLREYLPPINTQKPRPFEPNTPGTQPPNNFDEGDGENDIFNEGYAPAGSITPRPPFTEGYPPINPDITPPDFTGYPTPSKSPSGSGYPAGPSTAYPSTGYPTARPTYKPTTELPNPTTSTSRPDSTSTNKYPTFPSIATNFPNPSTGFPGFPSTSTHFPNPTTGFPGFPSTSTHFPNPTTGYPGFAGTSTQFPNSATGFPGYPSPSTHFPNPTTGYPGYPSPSTHFPIPTTGYPSYSKPSTNAPSSTTGYPSYTNPSINGPSTGFPSFHTDYPTTNTITTKGYPDTQPPITNYPYVTSSTPTAEENTIPSEGPHSSTPGDHTSLESEPTTALSKLDDELRHPPHIHSIDVECSKEMMTINIEFNRQFDGVIYSKGHYNSPECRYVKENSGQTKYTFTVSLNSCGTEFINAFDTQGQSYLENVLVLQNEPGIQEVWDTIRSVRCLWEGNLKKVLNVALSVGMLNQEIVTFSGDTAMARLDIQLGRGPFAPSASGLVKIGEIMTLVISVTGDPGFDIQVKDCKAKDSSGENVVVLTDDRGCVVKPKLFGSFQKTRNTGNTGASIIAYAFFSAFKFPDVMDLTLECNVDLCKTDCEMCPDPEQRIEPGRRRRRRDVNFVNSTREESVKVGKMLRVILPEDLNEANRAISFNRNEGVCMSTQGFVFSSALLMSLLTSSCLFSAYIWLKYRLYIKN